MRRSRSILLLALTLCLLVGMSACGKRGPLYLPDSAGKNAPPSSTP